MIQFQQTETEHNKESESEKERDREGETERASPKVQSTTNVIVSVFLAPQLLIVEHNLID